VLGKPGFRSVPDLPTRNQNLDISHMPLIAEEESSEDLVDMGTGDTVFKSKVPMIEK
jgi:hypothetical protein